jgi:hypothetical protein
MKKLSIVCLSILFLAFGASGALATSVLYDWAFNVDGNVCYMEDSSTVTGLDDSLFNYTTGLGTLGITYDPAVAGDYYLLSFFDHEIDETINTYFNEYGDTSGAPAAGQSWEIDEPGYAPPFGNIYGNFSAGSLDNTNSVPQGGSENDVSMAMGWDFHLNDGELAVISFILSDSDIPSAFYLSQTDPDSDETIYFSSALTIQGGGPAPVPEPSTMLLVGTGLIGILGFGRKKLSKT